MAKVIITIPMDYDFDRDIYTKAYDANGEEVALTAEQIEGLTEKEMLEHDRQYFIHGDYELSEFLSWGDYEHEDVKFELVEEPEVEDISKEN
jgi:hypothetical protein